MIRSMTGYARAETQGPWGKLSWELRSVNHRYLDFQIRLPEEFRAMENECRAYATQRLSRGKVEATLRYTNETITAGQLVVDRDRLTAVLSALATVASELRTSTAPDPIQILAWPGVVRHDAEAETVVPIAEAKALLASAFDDFTATRAREGERTRDELLVRIEAMTTLVSQAAERLPEVRNSWIERLRAKLADLAVDIDPARLAQEAALAAQRLDVDEELARLRSHFVELQATLRRDEAVGRRLDFLMQELNREANTLSSKSQDADMTRCAVEMKVLIEQMREQVQNIE